MTNVTEYEVSYYTNIGPDARFLRGWKPSDPVTFVGSFHTEAERVLDAAEEAFVTYQRIDGPHYVLDEAEAPSMSVGDLVYVEAPTNGVWLAVEAIGFRVLDGDEAAAVIRIPRQSATVAELRAIRHEESEDAPTSECPEHGVQLVVRETQTKGADPYAVEHLACGHRVACFGPGEPMVIL